MPLFRSDVRIRPWALIKRFALIYFPAAAICYGVAWAVIHFEDQRRAGRAAVLEAGRIEVARSMIVRDVSMVASDLRLVANLPLLKSYLEQRQASQLDELSRYFLVLAQEKRRYDHLLYVDAQGREVIRVDYNSGHSVIIPQAQLADDSALYFFRDTIKLGEGDLYVSPMELEVEQGRLETPYRAMIRFGMPVFDRMGHKKGVILLSYLGSNLLHDFSDAMAGDDGHQSMLLNRDGYWLSSDESEDEWGFMLGRRERSFSHDFPNEWSSISAGERGVLRTTAGLFAYTTARPLQAGQSSSTGAGLPYMPNERELSKHEYYWKIVSFVPSAALTVVPFRSNRPARLVLLSGFFSMLAVVSGFTAYIGGVRRQATSVLLENETRLREITRAMSYGLVVTDRSGSITFANPEACRLLGYDSGDLLGKNKHDLLHVTGDGMPCQRDECQILKVAQTGVPARSFEQVFRRKDGSLLPVSVSAAPIMRGRETGGTVVAFHDISEIKRAEQALRSSAQEIEDLYEHAPCGYHSLDGNGLIIRVNQTELEWLGYSREEVAGKLHMAELCTPESFRMFQDSFARFKEVGYLNDLEAELRRKDGSVFPVLVNSTALYDAEHRFVMSRSTLFDLTERKKLERALEYQAHTDALTGINNRRHFFELAKLELERSRRYKEPLALLMLDVDYFKKVNDTYGHPVGDEVLKKVSECCIHTLREVDILGRLGGEEFAVLVPKASVERALEVADRLRRATAALAVPLDEGGAVTFTISIGVTGHGPNDDDLTAMLRRADAALYAAKNAGRNCVIASLPESQVA